MNAWRRSIVLMTAVMTLAAACGGAATPVPATPAAASPAPATSALATSAAASPSASASTALATSSPPASPASASPSPRTTAVTLRLSQLKAPLDTPEHTPFNPAKLGGIQAAAGYVQAYWYTWNGSYVVFYGNLDFYPTTPLCPGNSIKTAAGFEDISNSPTAAGGCAGDDKYLAAAPYGVRRCGVFVWYATKIPVGTAGELYGSVEKGQSDGTIVGITSHVATSAATPLPIDLDAMGCTPAV